MSWVRFRAVRRRADPATCAALAASVAGLGLLPGAALGLELGGGTRIRGWLSWRAALTYWPEKRTREGARGAFAFGLTAATLELCASTPDAASAGLNGGFCAGVQAGALHAVVFDPQPTRPGDRWWSATSLALVGAFRPWASPLALELSVRALAPLMVRRFRIRSEPGVVFQQSRPVLTTSLGLSLKFD